VSSHGVVVVTGVGGMGRAIVRRVGLGSAVVLGDFDQATLDREVSELTSSGYDVAGVAVDVSDASSVDNLVAEATSRGPVTSVVHTAGLSPVQATAEAILKVDLLGTALMLDRFGEVISAGGAGVFVASMAGTTRLPDATLDDLLASSPTDQLLAIPQVAAVTGPGEAYGLAKRANQVRMWSACMAWGARGARVNTISPGIIATPMGNAELAGPSGEMMRAMIDHSATKRLGTPEDIAAAVEFLIGPNSTFITGTDLLVDGGAVPFIRSALAALTNPAEALPS
jgi:NAD(P)-dependent dehydrogenase (short-subunit alcohol dehydrogenase family)